MNIKRIIKFIINNINRKSKIAILHHGRCGSTVVGSLLNQHPLFHNSGEIFEKIMGKGPLHKERVKQIISNREHDTISKIYFFETKYPSVMHLSNGCINLTTPIYISLLSDLGYKKFILITRKNHLKRVISILKGRETGEWHSEKKIDKILKVNVPIDNFMYGAGISGSLIDYFKMMDEETKLIKETLGGKSLLQIQYEVDIEEDPRKAYQKICDFIGIKPIPTNVKFKKTNPFLLKHLIKNYKEVKQYFNNTPYSWMLDE